MNATEIFRLIEEIAATSSKNAKIALLKKHEDSENLKRVLKAALDPTITYGIRQWIKASGDERENDFSTPLIDGYGTTWDILEKLRTRKLTGSEAQAVVAVTIASMHPEAGELFKRVILKDLRAGFGDETVNKVWKNLIPVFPYMRSTTTAKVDPSKWDWSKEHYVQIKADGIFMNLHREFLAGDRLTTRAGTVVDIAKFPQLERDASYLDSDTVTHGEIVIFRDGKKLDRKTSNGIVNHIISGGDLQHGDQAVFFAWDQIPKGEFVPKGEYKSPYRNRYSELARQIEAGFDVVKEEPLQSLRLIWTEEVDSYDAALHLFNTWVNQGEEGAMLKNADGYWRDTNSGSKDQVKMKMCVDSIDLRIVGFNPGQGKFEGQVGSFVCQTEDALLEVNVNVRGDDLRKQVTENKADWLYGIISVEANDIIKDEKKDYHSLFLPVYHEDRRKEKKIADTFPEVQEKFAAAKKVAGK